MDRVKPRLVVFDLDYTLWSFFKETIATPPFHRKGSDIIDSAGHPVTPYPEVEAVLKFMQDAGIPLALASRTHRISRAHEFLQLFGWEEYFTYKEIYPGSKLRHFEVLHHTTQIPWEDMLFFDDEQRNIQELSGIGVNCVWVRNGLDLETVRDALERFSADRRTDKH